MYKFQRVKKSKKEAVDRINDLPDSILEKIQSLLPTKDAIATSVLSKKWNILEPFCYAPICLDIDDTFYFYPIVHEWGFPPSASFVFFVNKLLNETLRDVPCLESMALKCDKIYGDANTISWVSGALRLNVKKLVLDFHLYDPKTLFKSLNGCKTLVSLKVVEAMRWMKSSYMFIPDDFCLPSLKQLELNDFPNLSITELINGCTVLKELKIHSCDLEGRYSFSIQCPLLKELSITECWINPFGTVLELHAPNLETLVLVRNCIDVGHSFSTFSSIVSTRVCAGVDDNVVELSGMDEEEYQVIYTVVASIIVACSSTKQLYLSEDSLLSLHRSNLQVPQFQNLTWLTLGSVSFVEAWKMLACVLLSAPILKELTFEEGSDVCEGSYAEFIRLVPSLPICLELHLQKIEFYVLKYNEEQIHLFDYFLANGKVLEKLILRCYSSIDTRIVKRLLTLPHQSKICLEPL